MEKLDRRLFAYRPDLANSELKGKVQAERFVDGMPYRVIKGDLPLLIAPNDAAMRDTTLYFGDCVKIFEITADGWAWLQNIRDDYVGYAKLDGLEPIKGDTSASSHYYVKSTSCYLYQAPSIKAKPLICLSFCAILIQRQNQAETPPAWMAVEAGHGAIGYIQTRHLEKLGHWQDDPATMALSLVNLPYLWGGATYQGYDCSSLVQTSFWACGIQMPRDTDMQIKTGNAIGEEDKLRRNDLIFWKGHIGLMLDEENLLHANATDMKISIWPLATAMTKFKAEQSLEVIARRRIRA